MKVSTLVVSLGLVGLITTTLAPVAGAVEEKQWPVERANPGISRSIVDSLPVVIKNSFVRIASEFRAGSPIVYPNGKLVEGQEAMSPNGVNACWNDWFSVWGPPRDIWPNITEHMREIRQSRVDPAVPILSLQQQCGVRMSVWTWFTRGKSIGNPLGAQAREDPARRTRLGVMCFPIQQPKQSQHLRSDSWRNGRTRGMATSAVAPKNVGLWWAGIRRRPPRVAPLVTATIWDEFCGDQLWVLWPGQMVFDTLKTFGVGLVVGALILKSVEVMLHTTRSDRASR